MLINPSKIGLFIDSDNAPSKKIETIISTLGEMGHITIKRAYGNWTKSQLKGWEEKLHEHGIKPIQQFDLIKGKNASDIALCIDAMDIMWSKQVDVFAIVTSDCDFTPLAMRLQAEGKVVIGFGDSKAPAPFVNSCTKFVFLDRLVEKDDQEQNSKGDCTTERMVKMSPEAIKCDSKFINLVRNAIERYEDDDGWAMLSKVGSHISNVSSVTPENYGHRKLSEVIKSVDLFEVKVNDENNQPYVRDARKFMG